MKTLLARVSLFAASLLILPSLGQAGCADAQTSCEINQGSYELALPETSAEPTPVVIFLHGYGSNGNSVLKNRRIAGALVERGYAVIAPNALRRGGTGPTSWNFHPDFDSGRDEGAFFEAALQDAAATHDLDLSRVMLSGFSIGGSMTAYIACQTPERFNAYAPVGGNVWRPHPTECTAPVKLFHTHGWIDSTVPLEGRVINGDFVQGNVFIALNLWRQTNECQNPRANKFSSTGQFMRREWTECASGSALEFALFPGGHTVPEGWAEMALNWFEKHVPSKIN